MKLKKTVATVGSAFVILLAWNVNASNAVITNHNATSNRESTSQSKTDLNNLRKGSVNNIPLIPNYDSQAFPIDKTPEENDRFLLSTTGTYSFGKVYSANDEKEGILFSFFGNELLSSNWDKGLLVPFNSSNWNAKIDKSPSGNYQAFVLTEQPSSLKNNFGDFSTKVIKDIYVASKSANPFFKPDTNINPAPVRNASGNSVQNNLLKIKYNWAESPDATAPFSALYQLSEDAFGETVFNSYKALFLSSFIGQPFADVKYIITNKEDPSYKLKANSGALGYINSDPNDVSSAYIFGKDFSTYYYNTNNWQNPTGFGGSYLILGKDPLPWENYKNQELTQEKPFNAQFYAGANANLFKQEIKDDNNYSTWININLFSNNSPTWSSKISSQSNSSNIENLVFSDENNNIVSFDIPSPQGNIQFKYDKNTLLTQMPPWMRDNTMIEGVSINDNLSNKVSVAYSKNSSFIQDNTSGVWQTNKDGWWHNDPIGYDPTSHNKYGPWAEGNPIKSIGATWDLLGDLNAIAVSVPSNDASNFYIYCNDFRKNSWIEDNIPKSMISSSGNIYLNTVNIPDKNIQVLYAGKNSDRLVYQNYNYNSSNQNWIDAGNYPWNVVPNSDTYSVQGFSVNNTPNTDSSMIVCANSSNITDKPLMYYYNRNFDKWSNFSNPSWNGNIIDDSTQWSHDNTYISSVLTIDNNRPEENILSIYDGTTWYSVSTNDKYDKIYKTMKDSSGNIYVFYGKKSDTGKIVVSALSGLRTNATAFYIDKYGNLSYSLCSDNNGTLFFMRGETLYKISQLSASGINLMDNYGITFDNNQLILIQGNRVSRYSFSTNNWTTELHSISVSYVGPYPYRNTLSDKSVYKITVSSTNLKPNGVFSSPSTNGFYYKIIKSDGSSKNIGYPLSGFKYEESISADTTALYDNPESFYFSDATPSGNSLKEINFYKVAYRYDTSEDSIILVDKFPLPSQNMNGKNGTSVIASNVYTYTSVTLGKTKPVFALSISNFEMLTNGVCAFPVYVQIQQDKVPLAIDSPLYNNIQFSFASNLLGEDLASSLFVIEDNSTSKYQYPGLSSMILFGPYKKYLIFAQPSFLLASSSAISVTVDGDLTNTQTVGLITIQNIFSPSISSLKDLQSIPAYSDYAKEAILSKEYGTTYAAEFGPALSFMKDYISPNYIFESKNNNNYISVILPQGVSVQNLEERKNLANLLPGYIWETRTLNPAQSLNQYYASIPKGFTNYTDDGISYNISQLMNTDSKVLYDYVFNTLGDYTIYQVDNDQTTIRHRKTNNAFGYDQTISNKSNIPLLINAKTFAVEAGHSDVWTEVSDIRNGIPTSSQIGLFIPPNKKSYTFFSAKDLSHLPITYSIPKNAMKADIPLAGADKQIFAKSFVTQSSLFKYSFFIIPTDGYGNGDPTGLITNASTITSSNETKHENWVNNGYRPSLTATLGQYSTDSESTTIDGVLYQGKYYGSIINSIALTYDTDANAKEDYTSWENALKEDDHSTYNPNEMLDEHTIHTNADSDIIVDYQLRGDTNGYFYEFPTGRFVHTR